MYQRRAFAATLHPRRLAAVDLGGYDPVLALAATGDSVVCFKGEPPAPVDLGHTNSEVGSLWRLLDPSWLQRVGIDGEIPALFTVPGAILDRDVTIAPELVCLGTEHYQVTFQPDLQVITCWEAYVDDRVADRRTLASVPGPSQ